MSPGLPVSRAALALLLLALAGAVLAGSLYRPGPAPGEASPVPPYHGPLEGMARALENGTYSPGSAVVQGEPDDCEIGGCEVPCIEGTPVVPAPGMWMVRGRGAVPAWEVREMLLDAEWARAAGRLAHWYTGGGWATVLVAENVTIRLDDGSVVEAWHYMGGHGPHPCMGPGHAPMHHWPGHGDDDDNDDDDSGWMGPLPRG